ncbi:energy-coupling factor transporter ATPase [Alkalihalobacillus sp. MEB130]|uniref:ABC transporter ATP-binding protein n=1 Tax=Alkalihalobacillus sp. MEB130 TaxID=2976704 RepID=UPI0028DD94CA|nr:energy-coupling factor transporter ATPase [Alkalihalobacillus sp. MEB130]MDT8859754.1 energy-coupling factor transporter ATPase [Alkalihalobacillus sp. MEB130]
MAHIECKDVTFTYPDASFPALKNVSLQIEKGQFVVLCGPSGCGKSTLLRLLKNEIKPHGKLDGEIVLDGNKVDETGQPGKIGFVFQDPENQVVAEEVLHELVFGLENIGLHTNEMRNRVAEMVHFFGAETLLHRKTHELSGGQKQQLNLASVLLMQPSILLLDEPMAQLDPVSAREFLDMIVRLNEEFGITVVIAEHRLEEVMALADKIVMLDKGQIYVEGSPKQVMNVIWRSESKSSYVPSIPAFCLSMNRSVEPPLTVKEGKKWVQKAGVEIKEDLNVLVEKKKVEEAIHVKNLYYQYNKEQGVILKDLNFSLQQGDIYALLGGNGSGKSTFLKVLSGIYKPQTGKVFLQGNQLKSYSKNDRIKMIGYLPQNPKLFFVEDTMGKEIEETMKHWGMTNEVEATLLVEQLGIDHLKNKHPYDVSGGELQKAALACLLIRKPDILLLDEPTKGLDPVSKEHLATILSKLNEEGLTILMTTHDVEFAAKYATTCGMMFQGNITSEAPPKQFFKGNFFYTTMMQRLFRGITDEIVILEEAIQRCQDNN